MVYALNLHSVICQVHPNKAGKNKEQNQNKEVVKDMNRYFTKEDTQMANKHMQRCSSHLGNANEDNKEIPGHTY